MTLKIEDTRYKVLEKYNDVISMIHNNYPVYLLGINEYTNNVLNYAKMKNIEIKGIIDDYTEKAHYKEFPIYKLFNNNIDKEESIIISCVVDGKLITAMNKLTDSGYKNVINYLHLYLHDQHLGISRYFYNTVDDINNNELNYFWLYEILGDPESRATLKKLVDFKYNLNIDSMRDFCFNIGGQYFEDFLPSGIDEVFVDCGGYDGFTTKAFINRYPQYKEIYYIEPFRPFFEASKKTLKDYENIKFYNNATYCAKEYINFDVNGSASYISEDGNTKVQAITLDEIIASEVTFIKMDVEGAEYESLLGAQRVIKEYKPKLAICVYHKQEDFWRIPKLVLSYNPDYKVYLRHYTEGVLETVMYFI
ncbi:FkbM family methyltransferase [Alkaliphilus serpentinus]|uniref:FkbM family methyltransferase n=1 Tax=Alkaliphilus serpentinus TaxID=1482731 RepID=A0A833HMH4_9FIRM|nr:FkbM family methyltransferase [Alkaliphilus serpentinus]KAB3526636.1 FkbM family methyltransferase [Alkaliphilus serpentinus]